MRAAVFALGLVACESGAAAVVERDGARVAEFAVDVAETADARREGLRGYDSLAPGVGLWIAFPVEDEVCITNEGVGFAIDAVYVAGGAVTAIESFGAGEAALRCARADAVLEVAGGEAGAIVIGDDARLVR